MKTQVTFFCFSFLKQTWCDKSTFCRLFLLLLLSSFSCSHFLRVCHVSRYQIFLKPSQQSGFKKKVLTNQSYFPPSGESHVQPPALPHYICSILCSPQTISDFYLYLPKMGPFEFGNSKQTIHASLSSCESVTANASIRKLLETDPSWGVNRSGTSHRLNSAEGL